MMHFVGNKEKEEYLAMTPLERGKDLIINWEFQDGLNTGNNLWIDFNGLDMQHKTLWERQEFFKVRTENVASNFYPVTSSIAI